MAPQNQFYSISLMVKQCTLSITNIIAGIPEKKIPFSVNGIPWFYYLLRNSHPSHVPFVQKLKLQSIRMTQL